MVTCMKIMKQFLKSDICIFVVLVVGDVNKVIESFGELSTCLSQSMVHDVTPGVQKY